MKYLYNYLIKNSKRVLRGLGLRNRYDKLLALILVLLGLYIFFISIHWLIFNAEWDVVILNLKLYAFGTFPREQIWRPVCWLILIIFLTASSISFTHIKLIRKYIIFGWFSIIPIGIFLLSGGIAIKPVSTIYWGGLTLTLMLTLMSGIVSLPIGIVLAFSRQSKLILIKKISAVYIDGMRSIPLIAVLFFGQILTPLLLPTGLEFNRVVRAILSFSLFLSAYIAEDIRGGLQAIPNSQIESAEVLGLNKLQITRYILLPQALQISLPALTNQAIGLLQNTSLMAILGLVELLGISRSILANPEFIGRHLEVYLWLAFIYWTVCTSIALIARKIEKGLQSSAKNQL